MISAAINFLIVAAVVYFVIVAPYKKLKELDSKVEQEDTQLTLLTEIRDLLAETNGQSARHAVAPEPAPAPTPQDDERRQVL